MLELIAVLKLLKGKVKVLRDVDVIFVISHDGIPSENERQCFLNATPLAPPERNLSHTFPFLLCHGSYLPFINGHICRNGHIFFHKLKKKRLSPPHQGLSMSSPCQPAHSSLDQIAHFVLRQEHSERC